MSNLVAKVLQAELIVYSIITLAGLSGHPIWSWQGDTSEHWLQDDLPQFLEDECKLEARIWSYGYDNQMKNTSMVRMSDFVSTFLQDLLDFVPKVC
jgi:hypothetical protein